jgi:hypothetical protein
MCGHTCSQELPASNPASQRLSTAPHSLPSQNNTFVSIPAYHHGAIAPIESSLSSPQPAPVNIALFPSWGELFLFSSPTILRKNFPKNWECIPYRLGNTPRYSSCRHRVCLASTSSSRSVSAGSCRRGTFMVQGRKADSRKPGDDESRRC